MEGLSNSRSSGLCVPLSSPADKPHPVRNQEEPTWSRTQWASVGLPWMRLMCLDCGWRGSGRSPAITAFVGYRRKRIAGIKMRCSPLTLLVTTSNLDVHHHQISKLHCWTRASLIELQQAASRYSHSVIGPPMVFQFWINARNRRYWWTIRRIAS